MIAVLDASAAVRLALQPAACDAMATVLGTADAVLVPAIYPAEIANAFWKCHRFGGLALETCAGGLRYGLDLPDTVVDDREIHAEAFADACRLRRPVYDLLYVTLARRHRATLVSADKAMLTLASGFGLATVRDA